MKKAAFVFGLCFVLAFGGLLTAAGALHQDGKQAVVTETVLSGDPAAAKGLIATQKSQLRHQLLWETELPLGTWIRPPPRFPITREPETGATSPADPRFPWSAAGTFLLPQENLWTQCWTLPN